MSYKDTLKPAYIIDAQWGKIPDNIKEAIEQLWEAEQFGNHFYYYPFAVDDDYDAGYPVIREWLLSEGFTKDDRILLHYWW